jgi:DHA1 family tetracycline resistance protein-like MFS transporter
MQRLKETFKLSFFTLCFGAFLNWLSYGLIYPIFAVSLFDPNPIFLAGISNALRGFWLGVLLASTPLGQFFAAPIIGALSDQFGRKSILQITSLIIGIGYLICTIGVWEQNFILLVLGRAVTGIGAGNIAVINSAVADLSEPQIKAKNFALIAMANGLGFAAGPFLGGKLSSWGFDLPFIFASVLTLISFFFFSFLFSETLVKKKKVKIKFTERLLHLVKMANFVKLRFLFSAFFIFCFGWSFYWEFIPVTWIKVYGLNVSQIGNFYAYGSVIYVLSSGLLVRPILKRLKALPVLFTALLALGFCLLLLVQTKIEWYWVFISLQQFLIALIFPLGTALTSNAVAEDRQGEILGAFQSLQSFAFALTPFLGGVLMSFSYDSPLILGGIAMFLACLALFPTHWDLAKKVSTK